MYMKTFGYLMTYTILEMRLKVSDLALLSGPAIVTFMYLDDCTWGYCFCVQSLKLPCFDVRLSNHLLIFRLNKTQNLFENKQFYLVNLQCLQFHI